MIYCYYYIYLAVFRGREKILDPSYFKVNDWDENALEKIPNNWAVKPKGWLPVGQQVGYDSGPGVGKDGRLGPGD